MTQETLPAIEIAEKLVEGDSYYSVILGCEINLLSVIVWCGEGDNEERVNDILVAMANRHESYALSELQNLVTDELQQAGL